MNRFLVSLALAPLILFVATAALKLLWDWCGMGPWTGLGELPFGPAIFLSLILAAPFAAK